jgi:hypothetical protein
MRISLGWRKYEANFGRTCKECESADITTADGDGKRLEEPHCAKCNCTDLVLNVSVEMKPLPVAVLMDLLPHFKVTGNTVVLQSFLEIQQHSAEAVKECVRNLTGMEDSSGEPITLEQVASETVLTDFAVELAGQLVSISRLNEEDLGN